MEIGKMSTNPNKFPIFINLSNHPFGLWKKHRKLAALQIGKPIDLPFPNIAPEWHRGKVEELVPVYLHKCLQLAEHYKGGIAAVHIMGEMTFTFALVQALKQEGITTLASTTERTTHLDKQGNEVKTFHFVRFRKY